MGEETLASLLSRPLITEIAKKNDEIYFDDVKIDELKIKYNNKNFLLKIQYYIFEHLQHINHIFINKIFYIFTV